MGENFTGRAGGGPRFEAFESDGCSSQRFPATICQRGNRVTQKLDLILGYGSHPFSPGSSRRALSRSMARRSLTAKPCAASPSITSAPVRYG